MRGSYYKIIISLTVAFAMVMSLVACGGTTQSTPNNTTESTNVEVKTEVKKKPVKIKYPTYRVGTQVSAASEKKILADFKVKFGSEVEVEVEELPSDQTYVDKIKILAASSDLPDIVEGKDGIIDVLVKGNLATPLNEYLDADPQWKSDLGPEAIAANERDGKVWSASNGSQPAGYFYNIELFDKAKIKPAETWDEFLSNCEKLKAIGVAPIAMNTGENAWHTNLFLAAIVGTSGDDGNNFMNTMFPKNFENPAVIDALSKVTKMLQDYTTKDALGLPYANAQNYFLQEKAAIIANGPWMISSFIDKTKVNDGFDKKVGVAMYPGEGMFQAYEVGYMLCAKTPEKKAAAVKFLKYLTGAEAQKDRLELSYIAPLSANAKPGEEFSKNNLTFMQLVDLGANAKYKFKFFDTIDFANVTDAWKTVYPELFFNKATAEQVAKELSDIAAKNK